MNNEFKKWFAARARNPDKITLEEAFAAGAQAQHAPSEEARLVSYHPDGDTCTLNINGVEMHYDRVDRDTQPAPSVPDVDALAQFIREIDGAHRFGAGALAERIVEWLAAAPEAKP